MKYLIVAICIFSGFLAFGQERGNERDQSLINVHFSESGSNLLDSLVSKLMGNVVLSKDSAFMYCDTAILKDRKILIAYGNVSILQSDTIKVFCDSLYYHADSSQAYLYRNVLLQNGNESLKTSYLEYDMQEKFAEYFFGATLRRGPTLLKSKTGKYFVGQKKAEFYGKVQVTDSSFVVSTDTLLYNMRTEKLSFKGPTKIIMDEAELYCENGFYFLDQKDGYFEKNAQYKKNNSQATADRIFYHGELNDVVLEGNAQFAEDDKIASALKIVLNEETEDAVLTGDAFFSDAERSIYADVIIRHAEEERVETKGRTRMLKDSTELNADYLEYSDLHKSGKAEGEVVWLDLANDLEIYCDAMDYRGEPENITAIGIGERPLLIRKSETDSILLSADSLILTQVMDSLDTIDLFIAINNVMVLNKEMTASSDSLVYNKLDSMYSLYKNPYIWSDSTQFSGDTIHMILKEDEVHQVKLRNNSFVITENKEKVYDQIKGKNIDIFFAGGEVSHMDIKGSSESVYYIRDDSGSFLGVNKTECSSMRFFFEQGELKDIKFLANPTSKLLPIEKTGHMAIRLDGFNWNGRRKAGSKEDLRIFAHGSMQ